MTAREAIAESCASPNQMVSRYDYEYDLNGNRSRQLEQRTDPVSQHLGAAEETRYGYDALDRLVGVAYPDATATLYRLDPVGNRTGERRAPMSAVAALTVAAFAALSPGDTRADVTATFNRADWVLTQVDSRDASRNATYGYDLAGNLTQKQKGALDRAFRWSYRNTLTAVLDGGVEVGRYDYDAELQRVKRTTASEQVEYVLDEKHVLQEAYGAQAGHPSYRRYHYAGGPLAVVESAWSRVISTDGLGSATDLTNNAAAVTSMRKYDAWGQYRNDTAPTANQPKLGFTGHQYDPETGLVYARARYYDAEMGRFLSRDSHEGTLADAPSLHRFAYVRGNPLRYTDPSGEISEATATWARDREWQRYQAAPRGSPEAAVALQQYQFWQKEFEGARDRRILNEEVTFPLAGDAVAAAVVGPFAKAYRVVRVGLAGLSIWGGAKDIQKASGESGTKRTADIISGTGKIAAAALMLAPEIGKGAAIAVEKVQAAGEKVQAVFTAVEDSAAPGAVRASEQAAGRPAWGSVGAARAGDPFEPEPPTPPASSSETPRYVYRGGGKTAQNMTPRPSKDTDPASHPGLSTFEELEQAAPPGGKAQKIDLTRLKQPLVGVPDAPPEGHVSIRPRERVTPEMLKALNEWAETRQEGTHPFTQCLLEACVEEVRRSK